MRRVKWKGFYSSSNSVKKNVKRSRNDLVTPKCLGQTVEVHNGKHLKKIQILEDMIGHKLGSFFKTRAIFEYKKKKKKGKN